MLARFYRFINLPVLLEPLDIAALGMRFDLPQQFNNMRLVARLAGVGIGNNRFDFNRDDELFGSYKPGSGNSFAW
jgi:hypothetical protein